MLEHAADPLEETTLLAVADLHIWRGFCLQTGPGVLFVDGERWLAFRIGGLYEFELGEGYTISPQLHYDAADSEPDAMIAALALGVGF